MIVKNTVTRTDAYFVKPHPQETEVATNKPLFIRVTRQQFVEEENWSAPPLPHITVQFQAGSSSYSPHSSYLCNKSLKCSATTSGGGTGTAKKGDGDNEDFEAFKLQPRRKMTKM